MLDVFVIHACYVLCVPGQAQCMLVYLLCVMCSGVSPMPGQARCMLVYMIYVLHYGLRSDVGVSPMYVICVCYVFMIYDILCMCQGKPDVGVSPMPDVV